MIKVTYLRIIVDERSFEHKDLMFEPHFSILDYIKQAGFEYEEHVVVLSGKKITDLNLIPQDGDQIIVHPDVEWQALAFIGSAIWAAVVAHPFIAVATILAVGYSIYSAVSYKSPALPNFGTSGDGLDENSQTYSWDGIQTTQDVGTAIPVVYGEHRVGGNIINSYIQNDGDQNFMNILLALCEGEIQSISDVMINDQPAANFDGITVYSDRLGTNNDTIIPNFEDLFDNFSINQPLDALNDSYIYTTSQSDVEGFEVQMSFPAGIYLQNQQSGSIESWNVSFKVEHKLHTDSTWIDDGTIDVAVKQRTDIKRYFRKTGLTPGKYDIRVTRVSSASDFYHVGNMTFSYVVEIRTQDLSYPNVAKLGLRALATNQLSGSMPNITCLVKGKKVLVPRILYSGVDVPYDDYYWDPVTSKWRKWDGTDLTWDGTTYVEKYSANPVWCLKDLLTNDRYGLGQYINTSFISSADWIVLARYCDEKVSDGDTGYEKRFRMDVVIDSSSRAVDILNQLVTVFRGILFFSENSFKLVIDRLDTPVQLFSMGNIVEGTFNQTFKPLKETANVVQVQFLDKDKNYKQETISVIDEAAIANGDPIRKKEIKIFCTRLSQALREGKYQLLVSKYINRSIEFRAGVDAIACQVGDIISVSHDVTQWGYSGRVKVGSSGTSVNLDRTVTIEVGKTYKLQVRLPNDQIEEKTVTNAPGDTSTITVSSTFSQIPQDYDIYAFGESGKNVKEFRVMGMKRANDLECDITAIEYNVNMYDTDTIVLPVSNASSLSTDIQPVANLQITEGVVTLTDGTIKNQIEVWFNKPDDSGRAFEYRFATAKIYLSDDNQDSWKLIGQADGGYFIYEADLVKGKTYYVRVTTVAYNGMESNFASAPTDSITITAKDVGPDPVTNFNYTWGDLLQLVWSPNDEPDLGGYEIRDNNINWGTDDSHLVYRGSTNKKTLQPVGRSMGTFYIRAYNTSGIYSSSSNSITPTNPAPSSPSGLGHDVFFNIAQIYWNDVSDIDIKGYEIWASETNAWTGEEVLVGKTSGRAFQLQGRKPRQGMGDSATSTTIIDDALIGIADDYFNGDIIEIVAGTGAGQQRMVSDFNGTTGEVTISSAWTTNPDTTSRFIIYDRKYVKVRGYDFYGVGNFSTALTITYEDLDADSIGVTSITPEKILTPCLSALSANMGCLTAGVIQGGCFQTGSGGARTLIDSYGVRSYDTNCCMLFSVCNGDFQLSTALSGARIQFNGAGIFGYDGSGNKTLEIKNGCIWGQQLKLEDPACCCNYSFLDSGRLKFHDVYGDVPYITRICHGVSATGALVCLPGWKTEPKIIVSIKDLQSYSAASPSSCQRWSVYNDTPVCYCNSAIDYGYCFQVHACLQTTGSVGSECTKDVAFGTAVCTGSNACQVCARHRFQLWCNAACANYYYGAICYAVCYRVLGCGVWCACCFSYTQPHANLTEMQTTQNKCDTLIFPCGAVWELMSCQVSLNWFDSGINSGSSQTFFCLCTITIGTCNFSHAATCPAGTCDSTCSWTDSVSFTGIPSNVYCSILNWTYGASCVWECRVNSCATHNRFKCSWLTDCNSTFSICVSDCCGGAGSKLCCCAMPAGQRSHASTVARSTLAFDTNAQVYRQCSACVVSLYGGNNVSVTGICQAICYCVVCCSGTAGSCTYTNLYTITDTYATSCVLDPAGCLNWLAISYN